MDAELKDWLRQDKRDKTRSWCLAYNKSINGNITTMHRYAKAPLHLRNMKLLEESTKSSSFVIDQIQFRGSRDFLSELKASALDFSGAREKLGERERA